MRDAQSTLVTVICGLLAFVIAVTRLVSCDQAAPSPQVEDVAQETSTADKTWVLLGDSLTEKNFRAETSYYDYVVQDLGCTVINYGVSGTGYKEPAYGDPFYQRVDRMDVAGADCLTIFGSFNDLGKGYELGTADDETSETIGGCMNLTIQGLRAKNPSMRIGIATPTRWRTGYGYDAYGYESQSAMTREECSAYVALLKEVAAKYDIPVLDLYAQYGIDPDDEAVREQYYTEGGETDSVGAHPNSEGHRLMYPAWRDFVRELLG